MAVASEVHDIYQDWDKRRLALLVEEMDNNNLLRDYDFLLM